MFCRIDPHVHREPKTAVFPLSAVAPKPEIRSLKTMMDKDYTHVLPQVLVLQLCDSRLLQSRHVLLGLLYPSASPAPRHGGNFRRNGSSQISI